MINVAGEERNNMTMVDAMLYGGSDTTYKMKVLTRRGNAFQQQNHYVTQLV